MAPASDLSNAAQAVLHAYGNCIGGVDAMMGSERRGLVAALRTAAVYCTRERRILLTIAAELEGANG
jgi:hypothetical protein